MDLPLRLRICREYTGVFGVEAFTGAEVYVGRLVKQVTLALVVVVLLAGVVSVEVVDVVVAGKHWLNPGSKAVFLANGYNE